MVLNEVGEGDVRGGGQKGDEGGRRGKEEGPAEEGVLVGTLWESVCVAHPRYVSRWQRRTAAEMVGAGPARNGGAS